jgi:hypothetical protein
MIEGRWCRVAEHLVPLEVDVVRKIMAADLGQVKTILANSFRPDLGIVKAANLAGMMTSKLWSVAVGQNDAQKAIDILINASAYFWRTSASGTDKATLLWAHQKAR